MQKTPCDTKGVPYRCNSCACLQNYTRSTLAQFNKGRRYLKRESWYDKKCQRTNEHVTLDTLACEMHSLWVQLRPIQEHIQED